MSSGPYGQPLPGYGGKTGGMTSIGLEMVQVQALRQVKAHIELNLARQAQEWDERDKMLAEEFGQTYLKARLEIPVKWYSGARLGVLGMTWDSFPAIATMVDAASPSAESVGEDNSMYVFSPQLYIEAVIRSDAFPGGSPDPTPEQIAQRIDQEGLVDRRAKRTIEAIVLCISADPTLGSIVPELPAPQVAQTDAFNLDGMEPGDQSKQRIFSMIRVQYTLDTYASRENASQPSASVLPGAFAT